jgi:hypothetical protein
VLLGIAFERLTDFLHICFGESYWVLIGTSGVVCYLQDLQKIVVDRKSIH